jgi:hypothetical protein
MTTHVRKQIRDNIATVLTGLATTGTRVYKTRVYPLAAGKLPGLCIYTQSETSENSTLTRPRTKRRELDVVIEGYALKNSALDDELDKIAVEVEEALNIDVTRANKAKDTELISTEIDQAGEGETQAGIVRMTFRVVYFTLENNAKTPV